MDSLTGFSLCVVLALMFLQVSASKHTCEAITVPLCKDVGYNFTYVPNMFRHRSQDDAGLEIHQFFPLIKVQCSSSLKLLLCSLYVPMCVDDSSRLPPCRSLCTRAKTGCGALMTKFGFEWPEKLACDSFSDAGDCLDQDQDTGNIQHGPWGISPTIAPTTTTEQPTIAATEAPRKRPKVEKKPKRTNRKQLQMENLELDNERLKLSIKKLETEEEKLQLEKQYLAIKIRHLEAIDSK